MSRAAAPDRASPAAASLIGGRYRVLAQLGQGGMGTVVRVRDEPTGRELALKRLGGRRAVDDATYAAYELSFRREFHTLARLRHPRIVEVHEFGVEQGTPFYTMELLSGGDLRTLGPRAPRDACKILRDVASALAFLHARKLVHRDLAPSNIRLDGAGRAKLIDFGVLATPGFVGDVAGTPPFVAPETLRGLPLDHRADVFGLGGLAYWLLTGQHAFPARRLEDLESVWSHRPPSPGDLVAGIPPALEELVMSLLSLDPLARPGTAAEVIDRLQAIADLAREPELEVARSYLVGAEMVGRRQELDTLARAVQRAIDGAGGAVVIEAPSGMGKSRLLREVGLHAQLAGAALLAVAADATQHGLYGVARELGRAALAALPEQAKATARRHEPVIARVVPDLVSRRTSLILAPIPGDPAEHRDQLQSALASWFFDLAARRPLVILVDDAQRSDEASAALLTTLAHEAHKRPLLVVVAVRTDERARAAAAVVAMREAAVSIKLGGLEPDEVVALVRGQLGDVPNAERLASWIGEAAGGSPLACVELARELVDTGVLRYVDGIWVVPDSVGADSRLVRLQATFDARIAALSESALATAQALSVHGGELSLSLCVELAGRDAESTFADLDELADMGVILASAARVRFRHDALREALLRSLDDERRRELHLRVGHALSRGGEVPAEQEADVGWHLLQGGETRRGAELLERVGRHLYDAHSFSDAIAPLEAALEVRRHDGSPERVRMELLHFLHMAGAMASRATLLRYGDEAKHVFMKYSGMALAHRLGPVVGKALAFFAGIGWAWIRWLFATGWRRPLSPVAALHGFSVTLNTEIGAAGTAYEIERTAELVELCAPYTVFRSRLPYAAHLIGRAMLAVPKGHWRVIPPLAERALEILRTDRLTPVSEADRRLAETLVLHVHALAVVFDRGDGAEQLAALEQSSLPMAQVVAHVDRLAHRRWCGFENEAAALERGLDVMLVRIGGAWSMEAEIPVISGMAYGYVRDVVGLKRSIAQLEQFTAAGYRFGRFVDLAYGEYHRERGDLDASRDALERALLGHAEDEGNVRVAATAALAETLLAAGEIARARELAERACELGSDPIVGLVCYRLRAIRALALIDAAEGELARAAERLDSAIVEAEDLGRASIAGDMHDARARVALLAGDRARFRYHALQTERWFRPTDNPVLIARVERLTELSEARPTTARRSRIAEDAVTTVAAPSTVQYLDNTFE